MELNTEGQCDSDVSDSWSVVDFDGLASKDKDATFHAVDDEPIDECFELTEMTILDPVKIPLPQELPNAQRPDECHDSEGDTDGISIISEDEDYIDWKQAAHDNYQATMTLMHNTSRSPFNASAPKDEETVKPPPETQPYKGAEADLDDSASEDESLISSVLSSVLSASVTEPVDNRPELPQQETVVEHPWEETCCNYMNRYFFTSAFIAAITCIIVAQFPKIHGTKDRVSEVLQVVESLRGENEMKINNLMIAVPPDYDEILKKVARRPSDHPIFPQPLKLLCDETGRNVLHNRDALLACLQDMTVNSKSGLAIAAEEIRQNFIDAHAENLTDFELFETLVKENVDKLLNGLNNVQYSYYRLVELRNRLKWHIASAKKKKRKDGGGIRIVQWYPEDMWKASGVQPEEPEKESSDTPKGKKISNHTQLDTADQLAETSSEMPSESVVDNASSRKKQAPAPDSQLREEAVFSERKEASQATQEEYNKWLEDVNKFVDQETEYKRQNQKLIQEALGNKVKTPSQATQEEYNRWLKDVNKLEYKRQNQKLIQEALDSKDKTPSQATQEEYNKWLKDVNKFVDQETENKRLNEKRIQQALDNKEKTRVPPPNNTKGQKRKHRKRKKNAAEVAKESVPVEKLVKFEKKDIPNSKRRKVQNENVKSRNDANNGEQFRAENPESCKNSGVGGEEEACNTAGDWFFKRGKSREAMREIDARGMWYLKRMWKSRHI